MRRCDGRTNGRWNWKTTFFWKETARKAARTIARVPRLLAPSNTPLRFFTVARPLARRENPNYPGVGRIGRAVVLVLECSSSKYFPTKFDDELRRNLINPRELYVQSAFQRKSAASCDGRALARTTRDSNHGRHDGRPTTVV